MKAIVATKSGPPDVLQLREVDKPVPGAGEALIRVRAATVIAGDVVLRKLPRLMYLPMRLMGVRRKETPGHEFAGDVEAVGQGVERFAVGDRVFGTTTGLRVGANAEYVCLPADGTRAAIPDGVSYEQAAAAAVGGMTALHFLRQGGIQAGQKALIYGASGSVGSFAVQLAKHFGAEVTGVCSTRNVELVKSLGADHVVDYTKEDFTRNGETYDVIMDTVGNAPFSRVKRSLKPGGRFLMVIGSVPEMILARFQRQVVSAAADYSEAVTADAYRLLMELAAAGDIRAVIDRTYPLERIAEAHAYVDTGRKRGSVVITVGPPSRVATGAAAA